jgi:hypothetical protein
MSARSAAAVSVVALAVAGCGGSSRSHRATVAGDQAGTQPAIAAPAGHAAHAGRRAAAVRRSPASRTRPAQLVGTADAICRSYRQDVGSVNHATNLVSQERVFSHVVGAARTAIGKLRALSPPAAQSAAYARFVAQTSAAVNDFAAAQARSRSTQEHAGVAVEQQDFTAFQRAARASSAARGAARTLGLRVCGSAGSDWL